MELFFDTETSGKFNFKASYKDADQPWACQLAMILSSRDHIHAEACFLIQSDGREIEPQAQKIHNISTGDCDKYGLSEETICYMFLEALLNCDIIVCHNVSFDRLIMCHMLYMNGYKSETEFLLSCDSYCTMQNGTNITRIHQKRRQGYKWPTLGELYEHLFHEKLKGAHDALVDTKAMRDCYYTMTDMPF